MSITEQAAGPSTYRLQGNEIWLGDRIVATANGVEAAVIVSKLNSHARLLEACRQIVWKLGHNTGSGPVSIDRRDATVRMADAAIEADTLGCSWNWEALHAGQTGA